MEVYEDCVSRLNSESLKTKEKIENELFQAKTKIASDSANSCANIDRELRKAFEFNPDNYPETGVFSPQYVFDSTGDEIVRNTSYNKSVGILPNRRVIGYYYVLVSYSSNNNYYHFCNKCNSRMQLYYKKKKKINLYYCRICNTEYEIQFKEHQYYTNFFDSESNSSSFVKLEVDNYLNLYFPDKQVYLMYNNTCFPLVSFEIYKNLIKYNENEFCPFFVNININFDIYNLNYSTTDNYESLCEQLKKIKPLNYDNVFETLNGFRKLSSLFNSDEEHDEDKIEEEIIDPKEKTINSLNKQILELMDTNQNIRKTISDMFDQYSEQQQTIKNLRYELSKEKEDRQKEDNVKYLEYEEEIEKLKSELMIAKMEFIERDAFKQKVKEVKFSYEKMSKDYDEIKLENQKIKNQRDSLLEKIKLLNQLNKNYEKQIKEYDLIIEKESREIQKEKEKYNRLSIEYTDIKNNKNELEKMVKNLTERKNDAVVDSLYQTNDELKVQIDVLKQKNKKLNDNFIRINNELSNYKQTLRRLVS